MDLVMLVFALAVIGLLVHLITTKIEMDPEFKWAIRVIVVIVVILYLIRRFGSHLPNLLP